MPFHLPVQERLLSAPCAGSLAGTLVMAGHSSLRSPTWQLAITEETSTKKKKKVRPNVVAGRLSARLLPAGCPGRLSAVLRRAVTSYFGVTPMRTAAESQPCCARCCTRRGLAAPCPKEAQS